MRQEERDLTQAEGAHVCPWPAGGVFESVRGVPPEPAQPPEWVGRDRPAPGARGRRAAVDAVRAVIPRSACDAYWQGE